MKVARLFARCLLRLPEGRLLVRREAATTAARRVHSDVGNAAVSLREVGGAEAPLLERDPTVGDACR